MRRLLVVLVSLITAASLFADERPLRARDREFARDAHMILSAARPLTQADRAELAAKGVNVQSALTGGRYVARVLDAAVLANDVRFSAVESFGVEHKLLRSAYRVAGRGNAWADISVFFHEDVPFEDARAVIAESGGTLTNIFALDFGPLQQVRARIAPSAIMTLAKDDRVLAIGGKLPVGPQEQNQRAAEVSRVNLVHQAPYNLTGEGQLVAVSELSEAQSTHPEFQGRMVVEGGLDDAGHSTHVSGTIGAAGIRPDAKGMAPKVLIREFNVRNVDYEGLLASPDVGAVANNVSLGFPLGWCENCCDNCDLPTWVDAEEYFGAYDAQDTAAYDDFTEDTGTLLVFASGNYGDLPTFQPGGPHYHLDDEGDPDISKTFCFSAAKTGTDCDNIMCTGGCEVNVHLATAPFDTMTLTGSAKNVLAVGAVLTGGPVPEVTGFSSRGPAKDGRVKPEVVARGQSVLSTYPTDNYVRSNGTSMAAPVVTGIAALIGEQWKKTFGVQPAPEYIRGLIIAGAQDLGNAGPDYTYGYGIADAKNSVDLIIADNATGSRIRTLTLNDRTEQEVHITTTSTQKLRVLATWKDPSVILLGNDAYTAKALVNDIDIHIIDPAGNTHRPYVLDKVNYENTATRGVNTVDNNELIEIDNAPAGTYRVIIKGTRVVDGPQNVILISSAAGQSAAPPCTDANEPNDSPATATSFGASDLKSGAICTAGDVDHFTSSVNRFGGISVALTTGDTPLRLTVNFTDFASQVNVPANSTRTITLQYGTGNGAAPALPVSMKVEATGALGSTPRYDLAIAHGQLVTPKKRSVR